MEGRNGGVAEGDLMEWREGGRGENEEGRETEGKNLMEWREGMEEREI